MKPITVDVHINAAPERTFALASDFANTPAYIKGITKVEMLTPGPVGVGTKFKEYRGSMAETMEVTQFDPPRGYELQANSCGAHFRSAFRFEPEAGGTKMSMTFETKAVSLFAKLFSPMAFLMAKMVYKCVKKDFDDIKKAAEAG